MKIVLVEISGSLPDNKKFPLEGFAVAAKRIFMTGRHSSKMEVDFKHVPSSISTSGRDDLLVEISGIKTATRSIAREILDCTRKTVHDRFGEISFSAVCIVTDLKNKRVRLQKFFARKPR
jgi:hypothetical protein